MRKLNDRLRIKLCSRRAFILALISIAISAPELAWSQVLVADPTVITATEGSLTGQLGEYGETAARYAEKLKEWDETFKHYKQKIAAMQSLLNGYDLQLPVSLLDGVLQTVNLQDGVEQKCHPSSSGLSLESMVSALNKSLTVSNSADIVGQQRELCSKMMMMENMKYNEAVSLINDTLPKMTYQYSKILTNITSVPGDTEGNQQQKANDIAATDAETTAKFKAFEQRMNQYEDYISALQARQRTLAQMAFKGDKALVGALVKTTALKSALEIGD